MFIMDKLTYTIDADGVKIFEHGQSIPFLLQPTWPDGQEWADGEATAWAEAKVAELTDATAELAGTNPQQPTRPRPTT